MLDVIGERRPGRLPGVIDPESTFACLMDVASVVTHLRVEVLQGSATVGRAPRFQGHLVDVFHRFSGPGGLKVRHGVEVAFAVLPR